MSDAVKDIDAAITSRGSSMPRSLATRFKPYINNYTTIAIILIALAVVLRVIFTALVVPEVNSDEGAMGLEAMHIAFKGEHPIFLYGQDYMGVLEAYVAAFFFRLFGVSVFSMRVGMIIMFALFLVSMYLLTSLLYTRRLALVTLGLLGLGAASDVLIQQLRLVGGAIETLLFGSIVLLFAAWLALTARRTLTQRQKLLRLAVYGGWGLAAGLGLWTHELVLPFVLGGGLILAIFCYRDLWSAAPVVLLLSFLVGFYPFIIYNFHAVPGHSTIAQILSIQKSNNLVAGSQHLLRKRIIGTTLWSLPIATGLTPVCALTDLPYYGGPTSAAVPCALVHGSWSLAYLVLMALAVCTAGAALWKLWQTHRTQANAWGTEKREAAIIQFSRLMILLSAIITLALYVESPLSGLKPWSTRYLVGLLIAVPAVLWPLWQGAQSEIVGVPSQVACTLMTTIKRGVLALIIIAILGGTVATFASLPTTEADNQQQEAIIHDLLKLGATHVFTEYWIGYRLMIQSHEQIICAVPPGLSAPGSNRYYPYYLRVSADAKHAVYLFYVNSPDARTFASKIAHSSMHYRKYVFDGYEAYQPFNQ